MVGFWGYELAGFFDKVGLHHQPPAGIPVLHLGFFDKVIVYDHKDQRYLLASDGKKASVAFLKSFFHNPLPLEKNFHFKKFSAGLSKERFEAMVRKAKKYIQEGDIYQANLSQRFHFDFEGSPLRLYDALRQINPSPFASFFHLKGLQIISSSPERLVSKKGRFCETKPIAGTRPRPKSAVLEKKKENELRGNAKEQAEHIMLVDLERNDLGRVCEFNSVRVEEFMEIEKYSHVMHLVSKITGKLRKGKDGLDLIQAVFPGGTITGCPKIRCMEIIDELEPVGRGVYTGSMGYIDFNGDLDLNIVIRTMILQKKQGYLQVGAGIVHDSNPAREYEETLHKGEAMAQALVEASLFQ